MTGAARPRRASRLHRPDLETLHAEQPVDEGGCKPSSRALTQVEDRASEKAQALVDQHARGCVPPFIPKVRLDQSVVASLDCDSLRGSAGHRELSKDRIAGENRLSSEARLRHSPHGCAEHLLRLLQIAL